MKAFARRYRGYLWWLAGLAVFFAAYFSFRNSRTAMNWLCGRIVLPFEQAVGRLCGLTSVSVAQERTDGTGRHGRGAGGADGALCRKGIRSQQSDTAG